MIHQIFRFEEFEFAFDKEDDGEADRVQRCAFWGDAVWFIAALGDVVVECQDGAGEVEGRVEGVGEVVAEGEVGWFGGDGDAIALGEIGRVELFLLDVISLILMMEKGDEPRWGCRLVS